MDGPVIVMSALPPEHASLIEDLQDPSTVEIGSMRCFTGRLAGREVVLVRPGVGKVATATAVGATWERFGGRVFVFTGVAGGLSSDLDIGDIVIGERTIQHDAGVLGPGGLERYQAGHIPFFNPTEEFGYRPSPDLLQRVQRATSDIEFQPVLGRMPKVRLGTIVTGDQYLHDEPTRRLLRSELEADAVEMEGAAMAQAASLVGADHLVVRALSDLAGADSITDFGRYVAEVSSNTSTLVRAVLEVI